MAEDKMYIVRSFQVFLLLGYISVHGAVAAEDGTNVSCLADWTKLHRGCYKFGTEVELGWTEAHDKCKEYGAELVVILSESEKNELQQYLVDNYPDGSTWWAGLNREENDGSKWRWLDGSTVITKTTPWFNQRAIVRSGEFSGTLDIKSKKLFIGAAARSSTRPYICEYHSISQRPSDPPTPLPSPSEPLLQTEPSSYAADSSAATQTPQEPERTPSQTPATTEGRPCVVDSDGTDYGRLVKRLHSADDPLYRQYLQSEINANEAKVVYYQRVAGLYEAALQQQNQYYVSSREKLLIETDLLKKGSSCT